jgi:hypothetical protein
MTFFLRAPAVVLLGSTTLGSPGCTLIGAGIGAAIPRASDTETPMRVEAVPPGSDVSVVYYRPFDERGGGFLRIDGTYRGVDDGKAIVERGDKSYWIPVNRIQETRARPLTSSYSSEGALAGGVIDLALVAYLVWLGTHTGPGAH